jgi:5,6-dimethylbenzimidazole synthase
VTHGPGQPLPTPESFETLLRWRRDVRRFKPDPIEPELLDRILAAADLAPSVGNSQPWRIVRVETPALQHAARANFELANSAAAAGYEIDRRAHYQGLKLSGFDRAPVHLAIYCDPDPAAGHGLGRQTQASTLDHSCAGMIAFLWLAARTHGIGVGWVSILDSSRIAVQLDVPSHWRFIGYLLMGYPQEEHDDPELVRHGWQARTRIDGRIFVR